MQTSNYYIKLINSEETHQIRHPILRLGKPISTCVFDGDNNETTIHLGIYQENEIIGVCSFFKNNHDRIQQEFQYQLRGMAILKKFQRKGLGQKLLSFGENLLKEKNISVVWCNAREVATTFYSQNGYQIIGAPFPVGDIGLHYLMFKLL